MLKVYIPPKPILLKFNYDKPSIFLAGTIDMGNSINWQSEFINEFKDYDINVFNPRRDDWDSSWKQSINNPQFKEQVLWELNALEKADIIIYNFLPDSKSPITLFELGLMTKRLDKEIIVCCPDEFYRSGNVHIVCEKYNLNLVKSQENLFNFIKNII